MIDIRYLLLVREDKRLQSVNYKTRLVLYALSSRLDDRGGCYPSREQIAKDTNLSVRGVQRGVNEAVECGFLTRDQGRNGKSNYYTFPYVDHYQQVINFKRNPCQVGTMEQKEVCQVGTQPVPSGHSTSAKLAHEVDTKKVTKKVSLSYAKGVCQVGTGYDGTEPPKTREDILRIRKWCAEKGLTKERTREFLRINTLAKWSRVTQLCSVSDLIDIHLDLWKKSAPEEYDYAMRAQKTI